MNPEGCFVATFVEKRADRDYKDEGCEGKSRIIMAERINMSANTIPELLEKLSEMYGYDNEYWYVSECDGFIDFNQHEDGDSNPIDIDRMKFLWAKGGPVYLCDYSFYIEFQVRRDVTSAELSDAVKSMGATCG